MHRTKLLVAAVTALLTSSVAGHQGLVLCLGANGHRALEVEHAAGGCAAAALESGADPSQADPDLGDCVDVPSAGATAAVASSLDTVHVTSPPLVVALWLGDATAPARLRGTSPAAARAGPPGALVHVRTTVLLV